MKTVQEPSLHAEVHGETFTQWPQDLFIPPDALEVLLETFSGPLDLLLYLIRKQNMDILDIPIVTITRQYLQYIEFMETRRLSLAADYLVMAALLAEIKSRCLLPVITSETGEEEEDPRLELARRLQLYESIKEGSLLLDALPRVERDNFVLQLPIDSIQHVILHPEVPLSALMEAMQALLLRENRLQHHEILAEPLSVREKMTFILDALAEKNSLLFTDIIKTTEGVSGVVVSFLAILELARQSLVRITQVQPWLPVFIEGIA